MEAYFSILEYPSTLQEADNSPLQGLEIDGRLVAVTLLDFSPSCGQICIFSCHPRLFINSMIYGLIQAGKKGRHYAANWVGY